MDSVIEFLTKESKENKKFDKKVTIAYIT